MIFFALNPVFAVTVYLFYPETAGITLRDIDSLFFGDSNIIIVVDKGRMRPGFRKMLDSGATTPVAPNLDVGERLEVQPGMVSLTYCVLVTCGVHTARKQIEQPMELQTSGVRRLTLSIKNIPTKEKTQ